MLLLPSTGAASGSTAATSDDAAAGDVNEDDFNEDENEDVENLTLCDEEFELVDKLSAGSLGLQVKCLWCLSVIVDVGRKCEVCPVPLL